jgi:hypothetical protein
MRFFINQSKCLVKKRDGEEKSDKKRGGNVHPFFKNGLNYFKLFPEQ